MLLASALGVSLVQAQDQGETSYVLEDGAWEQLVLPGDASNGSLRQYFGDDLDASRYADDWIVFGYDGELNAYYDPGIDGTLPTGSGFWMLQRTGSNVVIDLPSSLPDAQITTEAACASDAGCATVDLETPAGSRAWNMVGAPFRVSVPVARIRVAAAGGDVCTDGCTLDEAAQAGLVGANYWRYDSDRDDYVDLKEGRDLEPLQGGWLRVESAAGSQDSELLYPCVPEI